MNQIYNSNRPNFMLQFMKYDNKWVLEATKQYIWYYYLSSNYLCTKSMHSAIEHGFKYTSIHTTNK